MCIIPQCQMPKINESMRPTRPAFPKIRNKHSRYGHFERKAEEGAPRQRLGLGKDRSDGLHHNFGGAALRRGLRRRRRRCRQVLCVRASVSLSRRRRHFSGGRRGRDVARREAVSGRRGRRTQGRRRCLGNGPAGLEVHHLSAVFVSLDFQFCSSNFLSWALGDFRLAGRGRPLDKARQVLPARVAFRWEKVKRFVAAQSIRRPEQAMCMRIGNELDTGPIMTHHRMRNGSE